MFFIDWSIRCVDFFSVILANRYYKCNRDQAIAGTRAPVQCPGIIMSLVAWNNNMATCYGATIGLLLISKTRSSKCRVNVGHHVNH